tara:strand:- start:1560 stop:1802 length:243 start_codon:yes stop_codon:yes gene_type:complete
MAILIFIFLDNNKMDKNILAVSIICGIFIYYRTIDYYKVLPRENIFVSLMIILWTYVSLKYNIWFIIVGLIILIILNKYL